MSKDIKRIIALAACLMMVFALAACGGGGGGGGGGGEEPAPPPAADPKPDEPVAEGGGDRVTVTYSMWGDTNELDTLLRVIEKFESEQDQIHVEAIQIDRGEYEAALNTMAVGGGLPDTAIMAEPQVISWAEQGMLLPAGDMFAGFPEAPIDQLAFRWGGETVGYSVSNEILNLYYNRAKFAEAGVDVPPASVADAWSWDEFIDVAKTMTIDANGNNAHSAAFDANNVAQYGVMFDPAIWMLEAWTLSNNGGFYDPADPNSVTIDQPAATDAIQMIADLHLVHKVSPQFGTNSEAQIDTYLLNDAAMYVQGQWAVGVWLGAAKNSDGLDYGVGVLPTMKRNVTVGTGGVNVTFASSKNQDAAKEWLAWYAQVENSWDLIESGIWMPIFPVWYTDDAKMHEWAGGPNFPPFEEYKSAVIDYAKNTAEPAAWYWVNNTDKFNDVLATALAPVWTGQSTAQDAIDGAMNALNAANKGN
ncbi:MAG: sugar ABC transporter substrate-binding protein [Clostridiales bacterium]|nr:sugar ABC transporter substrate-binding protein [Clostridiales bacterium]